MIWRQLAAAAIVASAATSAAAQTNVKIGVLTDMSGTYSDLAGPGSVWAAKKAVEDFNAISKGVKAEVVFADHQNKGDIASTAARKWYDTENVNVIVDLVTSSTALAVNEVAREKNKVAIVSGAASSDITGAKCNANTLHWTYDTYALANGTGTAVVKTGGDTWFFLTADYAFGQALERDTTAVITANGGKVLGSVKHPFPAQDFSSFLLQAQTSGAKIIGLANAGADTTNAIKQASEFGIVQGGQNLAGLLVFISDIHALGLKTAQGLIFTEAWYWDLNDANRAFAKEFAAANGGKHPTMVHAGVYSSVIHYLKAVDALKSADDGAATVAKMKELPTDDKVFGKGSVRADGRKIHDMYLFEVKKPEESKGPWDYYKLRATIPAAQAWRPLEQSACPLVKKS
ncbi:MAG: ABC transporter substrate-binding protein [Hyphomicrobiales bacterium]|nr:ABC transporter substrate-binding protein [Hyphomicrobiales bacterium]